MPTRPKSLWLFAALPLTQMNQDTLTLAIETSNPGSAGQTGAHAADHTPTEGASVGPGVALGYIESAGTVRLLGVEKLRSTRRHDDDLLAAIDRLWMRTKEKIDAQTVRTLGKRSIQRIAVSAGPGGYTGLRVSVAAAKALAMGLDAMCVQVPSACVVARRTGPAIPSPFGVALASKADRTVLSIFDAPMDSDAPIPAHLQGPCVEVDRTAFDSLGLRALVADQHLPEHIRQWCAHHAVPITEPIFDPVACLEAAAHMPAVAPEVLMPIYGREPEAVRKWRLLHGTTDSGEGAS